MSLSRVPVVLRARWKRIAVPTVLGGLGALAVSAALPPRYTAVAQVLLVDLRPPVAAPGGAAFRPEAARRIATQVDILTSQRVGLGAVDALGLAAQAGGGDRVGPPDDPRAGLRHRHSDRLLDALDVRLQADSNVIGVAVTDRDPAFAAKAANALARSYVDVVATLRGGAGGSPDSAGRAASQPEALVLDAATEPRRPSWPRPARDAALTALLGALLGIAAALAAESRDRRVRSAADLARAAGRLPFATLRAAGPVAAASAAASGMASDEPTRPMGPDAQALPPRTDPTRPESGRSTVAGFGAASLEEVDPPTRPLFPGASGGQDEGRPVPRGNAWPASGPGASPAAAAAHAATLERPAAQAARPAPAARQPIGQILVQSGLIHPPEVERILAWARQEGVRFGEAAVATRRVTASQLERALARQFDYPLLVRGTTGVADEVVAAFDASQPFAADLRRLRACVRAAQQALPPGRTAARALAVVSAGRSEGRSFVAANLAVGFAQAGLRTLLVDADLRTGRLHRMFGAANGAGLSTMLNHRIGPGALQRVPGLRDLTLLPCGPQAPNPTELLSRDALGQLLEAFVRSFDAVILDTSAAADEPDAMLVAQRAGAALLLARSHLSRLDAVEALARTGLAPGTLLLGSVLDAG